MLDPPDKSEKPKEREPARTPLHESTALAAWVFGGLILLFLMIIVFVKVDPSKFPIIRFLMALSAGFFAYFFVGGVVLKGTLRGFAISAAGGAALFILIQFVFDPFQVLPTPLNSPIPAESPSPIQTPSPAPSPTSSNASAPTRTVTGQTASSPVEVKKSPTIDVRQTLAEGQSLTDAGNSRDKEKALQLYRTTVAALNRADLPQALLREAEAAYNDHNNDAARDKYKAVLQVYLRNNQ